MTGPLSGPVLVTGGAGFIGSNLADALASAGHSVMIYDALARPGVERNLDWLRARHGERIIPRVADVRDRDALRDAVNEASAVFHLAAQVAVTTSLVDPRDDFEINLGGTFALLESLRRKSRRTPLIFASTNKVYGNLADLEMAVVDNAYVPTDPEARAHGVSERRSLDFHTPYGCSKGAADQYVLDYARSFDLPACVIRMSCIYGPRQMGTEDQGWVAHFAIRALRGEPITLYGDGRQVRGHPPRLGRGARLSRGVVPDRAGKRMRVQSRWRAGERAQPASPAGPYRSAARSAAQARLVGLARRGPALFRGRRARDPGGAGPAAAARLA